MDNNIQLNNPQEVLSYISRESDLLKQYAELISQEAKALSSFENVLAEATQRVNSGKRGLYVAIEQTKRQEDSPAKQQALSELQKKMEKYESQARTITQCTDDLIGIRQDYMALVKDSAAISDTTTILSGKIQQLLERIIGAI